MAGSNIYFIGFIPNTLNKIGNHIFEQLFIPNYLAGEVYIYMPKDAIDRLITEIIKDYKIRIVNQLRVQQDGVFHRMLLV